MLVILNIGSEFINMQKAASVLLRAKSHRDKRSPEGVAMPQSHFSIIFADCLPIRQAGFGAKRLAMTFPCLFVHPLKREL